MGGYLTSDNSLMKKTYVIGFTSFNGKAGALGVKQYTVETPRFNSFERWINKSYDYAFVDFKSYNKNLLNNSEDFYLKAIGHVNIKREWNKNFDGNFLYQRNVSM